MRAPGPVLVYTSSRIAIFAITLAVLYAFGMRQILLLAVAVLVSGLLSFVLLSRQRDAMSSAVVERGTGMRQRLRERTEAEDAAADALLAEQAARDDHAADAEPGEQGDGVEPGAASGEGEPGTEQDRER